MICKKCFKLFEELDELEHRLDEIKNELVTNYTNTTARHKNGEMLEETESIENGVKIPDSNKENELPRKILDIPSSDDDTSQVRSPLILL